jgi:predicted phage replisome organizer
MSDVKWIKISTAMFDSEKIRFIDQMPDADGILTIWVKLLVLAGKKNMGGEVYFNDEMPYTEEMLAAIFHRRVNTVRMALETFCKLRMITISEDKTIIICNWSKYQNVEGLDKLRLQNVERKRRQRDRQKLLVIGDQRHVTSHVTSRDTVTVLPRTVIPQIENHRDREEPPTVPQGGTGKRDLIELAEAQRCFNELFGRNRAWSDDEEGLLARLLPISRADFDLIQWGYSLNRDSEGWALINGDRVTKPKQSLIMLLREFNSEIDKWRSVQRPPQSPNAALAEDWPEGAKAVACALYGDTIDLTRSFSQMPASARNEIEQHLRKPKLERAG